MVSKMRILMLSCEYPPLGGGTSNATYYLLNEFSQIDDITYLHTNPFFLFK